MNTQINPNKALWEKGDFTRIAESMRESGEALVTRLGIMKGLKVLDLGCGDGTTALPAARLGADVLGVDIAKKLVEARHWHMGHTSRKGIEGALEKWFNEYNHWKPHQALGYKTPWECYRPDERPAWKSAA
jgi:2-polyprenyl-3-methyl-5-hydroxy-6-metoxy-1,4-benzoquinol methylase